MIPAGSAAGGIAQPFASGSWVTRLVKLLEELLSLEGDAKHLGRLAEQDLDRETADESDEDGLGQEVGEETQPEEPAQGEDRTAYQRLCGGEVDVVLGADVGEASQRPATRPRPGVGCRDELT